MHPEGSSGLTSKLGRRIIELYDPSPDSMNVPLPPGSCITCSVDSATSPDRASFIAEAISLIPGSS